MSAQPAKVYRLNLIRALREKERKNERQRNLSVSLGAGCFGLLVLAAAYAGLTIWNMEMVLTGEQEKLSYLQREYQKYTATRMIVDKDDLELLNSLQGRGIFWTRKLAAMAKHLPDNYWITNFSYNAGELRVAGYGYASSKQDQLLVLDEYLNRLRLDSSFSDAFKVLYLNNTQHEDDQGSGKVAFEFSAFNKDPGKP